MKKVFLIFMLFFTISLFNCDLFSDNKVIKNFNTEMEVKRMPINLITAPTGGAPLTTADYNAQNIYIQALMLSKDKSTLHLTEWDSATVPALSENVYINHGGALFQVQDSDYAITGSPSDGRVYVKIERSGDTLISEFVNSASGYSWNYVYSGFYHADGSQLLPYVLVKSGANYLKYRLSEFGDNYDISDDSVNIGYDLTVGNYLTVTDTVVSWKASVENLELRNGTGGGWTIAPLTSFVIPAGTYIIAASQVFLQVFWGAAWRHDSSGHFVSGMVFSDGTNMRLYNPNAASSRLVDYIFYG